MSEPKIIHSTGAVPYAREMLVLIDDDENWLRFCLQITKWPVNTHVRLLLFCRGEGFPGSDKPSLWLFDRAYEIDKLSNTDFEKKREKLILKYTKLAQSRRKKILATDRKK